MALVSAVMHLYNIFILLFLLSIPFLYLKQSGIDKSTEWSTRPACPSVMCFHNVGNVGATNSLKILYLMFMYVCFM